MCSEVLYSSLYFFRARKKKICHFASSSRKNEGKSLSLFFFVVFVTAPKKLRKISSFIWRPRARRSRRRRPRQPLTPRRRESSPRQPRRLLNECNVIAVFKWSFMCSHCVSVVRLSRKLVIGVIGGEVSASGQGLLHLVIALLL